MAILLGHMFLLLTISSSNSTKNVFSVLFICVFSNYTLRYIYKKNGTLQKYKAS